MHVVDKMGYLYLIKKHTGFSPVKHLHIHKLGNSRKPLDEIMKAFINSAVKLVNPVTCLLLCNQY